MNYLQYYESMRYPASRHMVVFKTIQGELTPWLTSSDEKFDLVPEVYEILTQMNGRIHLRIVDSFFMGYEWAFPDKEACEGFITWMTLTYV